MIFWFRIEAIPKPLAGVIYASKHKLAKITVTLHHSKNNYIESILNRTYFNFNTLMWGGCWCELWNREGKQVCWHLRCWIKSSVLPVIIYNTGAWESGNKADQYKKGYVLFCYLANVLLVLLCGQKPNNHTTVAWRYICKRQELIFSPDLCSFPRAIVSRLWIMVTLNTAFISGSSKQGNTFLAYVGSILVAARNLRIQKTFIKEH